MKFYRLIKGVQKLSYTDQEVAYEEVESVEEEQSIISGDLSVGLGMTDTDALADFGIDKANYTLTYNKEVPIRKIIISEPMKKGRKMTIRGLTKSIGELGVVEPIHVMRLENADAFSDEDADAPEFMLLHGMRRLFGAIRNNLTTIPCVIWDFKDKSKGREAALVLGLTLNRTQRRSWSEIWDLYNVLEMQSQIKPSTFESLFQLEGGDAMKLKDVMFCEYPEIKDDLLSNLKTLDQCYKQLQKLRKEENRLDIEDRTGFSDTSEEAKEIVAEGETVKSILTEDEVAELLELGDAFGKEVSHSDFSEMDGYFSTQPEYQSSKNRKPLDPVKRQKILERDEYTCMCCGMHGPAFAGALIVHHIIPVHCFGDKPTTDPDADDNLVTLCDSCHLVLHCIERDGRLPITEEQFNQYEYDDQLRIRNILHYARIAIIASKRAGLTDEERKKLAKEGLRHRMPGEQYKENLKGYELFEKKLEEIENLKKDRSAG
jgi:5-methylcytosine-specific restriction protein A